MMSEPRLPFLRLLIIDLARKTQIRNTLPRFRETQWLSLDEIQDLQLEKLKRLADFIIKKIPFYREISQENNLSAIDLKSLSDISRFPVMTKSRMKSSPTDYLPTGGRGEATLDRRTGGSTGTPFQYKMGVGAITGQWAAIFRAWEWSGYCLGDKMVTIGGGSVGQGASLSQRFYNALRRNTSLEIAPLDENALDALEAHLLASGSTFVYGYPSVLYQVARHVKAKGGTISGVKSIVTTSEMIFPGQRRELEAAFGAPVFDQYGCNEVNLVNCECEAHDGWHMAMESSLVEILDDKNNPVPDGQVGRIVATGLDNFGMPFVRYDTGDLGALNSNKCSCGRQLTRIVSLQGRTRDLVRAADGRMIHGVAFNGVILQFPWVDRYQAIQVSKDDLTLIVASSGNPDNSELENLTNGVSELCGLRISLKLNAPFELTSGQKTRVIISQLQEES